MNNNSLNNENGKTDEENNDVSNDDDDDDCTITTQTASVIRDSILKDLNGSESFLVGISPTYWSHVPMFIGQIIHQLKLINGINCMMLLIENDNKIIPISKCHLIGCIVSVEQKSNGCILYVLDDGTGLIDCLHWSNDELLPSLTGTTPVNSIIEIGQIVHIYGRIQCIGEQRNLSSTIHCMGKDLNVTPTKREIHVTVIEPISSNNNNNNSYALPTNSLNRESQHWMKCCQYHNNNTQVLLKNSIDIIEQYLGIEIAKQVADQTNLPAVDDSTGHWRLFGTRCPCSNDSIIKQELLYCHCIATPEEMDPMLQYRDALLKILLQKEHDVIINNSNNQSITGMKHLRFLYRDILNDEKLNKIAIQQIHNLKKGNNNNNNGRKNNNYNNVNNLIQRTFHILRNDGILYLLDINTDTYILISKQGILEPYIRKSLECKNNEERIKFHSNKPSYLDKVPKARLQIVRRSIIMQK